MTDYKEYLGLTREELVGILGEPDAKGGTSRKYKTPRIFKYGDIEYCFGWHKSGTLNMVFHEPSHTVLASTSTFPG